MILSAIAAMARNRAIGSNNKLLWDIPEEMKYFRTKTKGAILIVGRKTFESLPSALPGRFHIIVTRDQNYKPMEKVKIAADQFLVVTSLEAAIDQAKKIPGKPEEVFIIGGAEIYKQCLSYVDKIYLTHVDLDVQGDTFFPEFSEKKFPLTHKDPKEGFTFCTYEKATSAN